MYSGNLYNAKITTLLTIYFHILQVDKKAAKKAAKKAESDEVLTPQP